MGRVRGSSVTMSCYPTGGTAARELANCWEMVHRYDVLMRRVMAVRGPVGVGVI